MSTKAHTTVRLGDLVVVAFDWAAQCSSDPRETPILATKAVAFLLRHSRKISLASPAPLLLPPGDVRALLALESTYGRVSVSALKNG
jgi:hypothetical protein